MLCQVPTRFSSDGKCRQEAEFIVRYETGDAIEELFACGGALRKWVDGKDLRLGTVTITPMKAKEVKHSDPLWVELEEKYHILLRETREGWSRATEMHGPMNSAHEAYAVILERLEDFWHWSKTACDKGHRERKMRRELIQVAAMACRTIQDLKLQS